MKKKKTPLTIHLYVQDEDAFFTNYRYTYDRIVSDDVCYFLLNRAKAAKPKTPLQLVVHSDRIPKDEENRYRNALFHTFELKILELEPSIRRVRLFRYTMLGVGLALLLLHYFLFWVVFTDPQRESSHYAIAYAGGVFFEAALEVLVFDLPSMLRQRQKWRDLRAMEITFQPLSETDKDGTDTPI